MPSKLANKIVQSNSKQLVSESFDTAMWEVLSPKLVQMKSIISSRFLREAVDSDDDLQDAIDYVIDCMNDNGVEDLPNAIEQAAKKFSVAKNDLEDAFEDCLNDNADDIGYDDGPQISEGFLGQLDTILTEGKSKTVIFENQSAKVVSPNEAQSLFEMYSSLNKSNKEVFKTKLSESKQMFEKMVNFAKENMVMNEDKHRYTTHHHPWENTVKKFGYKKTGQHTPPSGFFKGRTTFGYTHPETGHVLQLHSQTVKHGPSTFSIFGIGSE